jgi:N-acetylglucosaminyldiphosphoundecaprenol N-acetyl-beta-D-mannosaminyltransferase
MISAMQPVQRLDILGTRVASVTYDEALTAILDAAHQEPPAHAYVCAVNVHTVSLARRDAAFRDVLNGALLAVPDGKPLIWAHRFLGGRRLTERVYGPTLMLRLCELAAERRLPVYLYGGAEGVAPRLADVLRQRWPKLQVAGTCTPPFADRAEDDASLQQEIAAINASGARLLFVALGAPKQERFMHRHAHAINPVQIGVGAAFDFHSGRVPQAPPWMQDAGLEWFHRFCSEPRRLWKRYLFYNPYFVASLALQRLGLGAPVPPSPCGRGQGEGLAKDAGDPHGVR